jgi:two-component system chemotaxis response regulator CheB
VGAKIKRMVAVASSAGGLRALSALLGALPADFGAPIMVVQHLDPDRHSFLAEILGRRTVLRVKQAEDGERMAAGTVYLGPPGLHLMTLKGGVVSLSGADAVHFLRPAADMLFDSVATCYGPRAIAVVLTGSGADGAAGIRAVKRHGGTVIAQDEGSSEFFSMPREAIATGCVDQILPLEEIASALTALIEGQS